MGEKKEKKEDLVILLASQPSPDEIDFIKALSARECRKKLSKLIEETKRITVDLKFVETDEPNKIKLTNIRFDPYVTRQILNEGNEYLREFKTLKGLGFEKKSLKTPKETEPYIKEVLKIYFQKDTQSETRIEELIECSSIIGVEYIVPINPDFRCDALDRVDFVLRRPCVWEVNKKSAGGTYARNAWGCSMVDAAILLTTKQGTMISTFLQIKEYKYAFKSVPVFELLTGESNRDADGTVDTVGNETFKESAKILSGLNAIKNYKEQCIDEADSCYIAPDFREGSPQHELYEQKILESVSKMIQLTFKLKDYGLKIMKGNSVICKKFIEYLRLPEYGFDIMTPWIVDGFANDGIYDFLNNKKSVLLGERGGITTVKTCYSASTTYSWVWERADAFADSGFIKEELETMAIQLNMWVGYCRNLIRMCLHKRLMDCRDLYANFQGYTLVERYMVCEGIENYWDSIHFGSAGSEALRQTCLQIARIIYGVPEIP